MPQVVVVKTPAANTNKHKGKKGKKNRRGGRKNKSKKNESQVVVIGKKRWRKAKGKIPVALQRDVTVNAAGLGEMQIPRAQMIGQIAMNRKGHRRLPVAQIVAQMSLPYDAKLVRVSPIDASSFQPTALARNFIIVKYNIQNVVDIYNVSSLRLPVIAKRSGIDVRPLWGNLADAIPVVQTYDLMVLGILPWPMNTNVNGPFSCYYVMADDVSPETTTSSQIVNAVSYYASNIRAESVNNSGTVAQILMTAITPSLYRAVSANAPYGASHIATMCAGSRSTRAIWIDAAAVNSTFETTVDAYITMGPGTSVAPPATSITIRAWRCFGGVDEEQNNVSESINTPVNADTQTKVSLKLTTSGYYYFTVDGLVNVPTPLSDASLKVTFFITTNTTIISKHIINTHVPYGTSSNRNQTLINRAQVNGCGLLITNTTQEQGQGGNVYGYSNNQNLSWFENTTANTRDDLIAQNRAVFYEGKWKEGVYGFIKPQFTPWKRRSYIDTTEDGVTYPNSFVLGHSENEFSCVGYNVFTIAPIVGGPNNQTWYTNSAVLHFAVAYEYETNSQNVLTTTSNISTVDTIEAFDVIRSFPPPFSPNDIHLPIWVNRLKNGVMNVLRNNGTRAVGKALMVFGHPAADALGRILIGANDIANKIPM